MKPKVLEVKDVDYDMKKRKLRPIGKKVYLSLVPSGWGETKSGLIVERVGNHEMRCRCAQAKVLAVGPDVRDIKAGDEVLYELHHEGPMEDNTLLAESDWIICVLSREE